MRNYKNYFAFFQEPFAQDIPTSKLYQILGLKPTTCGEYEGQVRQVIVRGNGQEKPSFSLPFLGTLFYH